MDEYSIRSRQERETSVLLCSLNNLIDSIVKQAVQHPYGTGFSVSITIGMAAKGFGAPNWLSLLIALGTGYFTAEGLKKVKTNSHY